MVSNGKQWLKNGIIVNNGKQWQIMVSNGKQWLNNDK